MRGMAQVAGLQRHQGGPRPAHGAY